jgi:hypothetical protein
MAGRLLRGLLIVLILADLGFGIENYRQTKVLNAKLQSFDYDLGAFGDSESTDAIEPTVGTIQFLRRGYTIQLEAVKYEPSGLTLTFAPNSTNCNNTISPTRSHIDLVSKRASK